jgi:serine/threonine protein phosphatase 1
MGDGRPSPPIVVEPLDASPLRAPTGDSSPPGEDTGRTVIVGHTSQEGGEVLDLGHPKCIDIYCHGGGWLTALDVGTEEVWQADRDGRMRR